MPTIAVLGAGPSLGLSIARRFGSHDFAVGLVARSVERLDYLVRTLRNHGIQAAGFAADVTDRPSLVAALGQIEEQVGPIDVLEYSPAATHIRYRPVK
jgi:NADP-dependent 3-hydroxy acid dehydrogenase YdfG